jgi:intein/homing endonuclease
VNVDFSRYNPSDYLLSWITAVAGVEVEDDGHTICSPHSHYINDNGNSWMNQVLLESYHSFIMAENFVEHVSIPEFSKGKVLDAVAWVVEKQYSGHREPIPTVFIDVLLATSKKKHPLLVKKIIGGVLNSISMGCDILWSQCSRCGKKIEEGIDEPCVIGNTRIITSEGYVRIGEQIRQNNSIGMVLSEYGNTPFDGVISRGVKKIFRVRTDSGENIYSTGNHRFRVLDVEGGLQWKMTWDLIPGDFVLSKKGCDGLIPEDRGESTDFWYALGHLYGDGHREYRGEKWAEYFHWQSPEDETDSLDKVLRFFSEGGIPVNPEFRGPDDFPNDVKRNEGLCRVRSYYPEFTKVLPPFRKKGQWRCEGVPEALWRRGRAQIAAFLNGLFTTDGGVGGYITSAGGNTRRLTLGTKYRKLAQDIKKLALLFGVIIKIKRWVGRTPFGVTRSYRLEIKGTKSWINFANYIGFSAEIKTEKLERVLTTKRIERDYLGFFRAGHKIKELVPYGTSFGKDFDSSERRQIHSVRKDTDKGISDVMLPRVLDLLDKYVQDENGILQEMRSYLAYDWWFDKVVKVEPWGEMEVFDAVDSESSSYLTNGIVSHNCTHIKNELGKYYIDKNGIKRRVSELCGLPGIKDSCSFKEVSWVSRPAFLWARMHGFLEYSDVSTGQPLKAIVPMSRYKESNREI